MKLWNPFHKLTLEENRQMNIDRLLECQKVYQERTGRKGISVEDIINA